MVVTDETLKFGIALVEAQMMVRSSKSYPMSAFGEFRPKLDIVYRLDMAA